jgi:hypothetical protein
MLTSETTGINIGCDLGQSRDSSGFVVAEGQVRAGVEHYVLRAIERAQLGTDYVRIASRLNELYVKTCAIVDGYNAAARERVAGLRRELEAMGPLAARRDVEPMLERIQRAEVAVGRPGIYLDVTGLGGPFLDFLLREFPGLPVVGVTITSGEKAVEQYEPRGYQTLHVGKEALIGRLQVLLGSGRIHMPQTPVAEELERELKAFEGRTTAAKHVRYEAKAGEHDDLVLSAALAVWSPAASAAERVQVF